MRPRLKKNLDTRLEKCSFLLEEDPEARKGAWDFGKSEVHLEIGCGKGAFICGMAAAHPEIMFVGVECVSNVIVMAMEKAAKAELENVKFIRGNARYLGDWFEEGEIDRIYLNFSDPWPKSKHEKNRLTSGTFMPLYIKLLKEGGGLIQKTDNRELFDYSLEAYKSFGCIIDNVTYDLHGEAGFSKNADGMGSGDVVTEYESRFIGLGMPICRAEVTMPPKESAAEKIRLCEAALKKRKEAAALGRAEPEKRKT